MESSPMEGIAQVILSYLSHDGSVFEGLDESRKVIESIDQRMPVEVEIQRLQNIVKFETLSDSGSIKRATRAIVESLLLKPDIRLHQEAVNKLCLLHLEILEAVKVIVTIPSSPPPSSSSSSHSQNSFSLLVGCSLLLATIAKSVPHLRGSVEEMLIHCRSIIDVNEFDMETSDIDDVKMSYAVLKLVALRILNSTGCLRRDALKPDLGRLLSLIHAPNLKIKYHSLCLLCDLLSLPSYIKEETIRKVCGDDNIEALILDDTVLSVPQLVGCNQDVIPSIEKNVQQSSNSRISTSKEAAQTSMPIISTPFGNSSVFVSGYALPHSSSIRSSAHDSSATIPQTLSFFPPLMQADIIETPTTRKNLQRLAQAVLIGAPIIVQGAVGCGKSFLIRKIASGLGHDSNLIEVHLDDQTDSRSLIGAYVCSDVPGEFNWQPGLIYQAATLGRWLVIEDIDKVPLDVIATISSLLERRKIYAPNRMCEIDAHPSFRLFGTRTLTESNIKEQQDVDRKGSVSTDEDHNDVAMQAFTVPANLRHFSYFWHYVNIETPAISEIELIVKLRYPLLLPVAVDHLLETYLMFSLESSSSSSSSSSNPAPSSTAIQTRSTHRFRTRLFTLRDLMKAASRLSRYGNEFNHVSGILTEEQKRNALNEIVDVFAASIRDEDCFLNVVYKLGACWGVTESEIDAFVIHANPELHEHSSLSGGGGADRIVIGRVVLPKSPSLNIFPEGLQQQFAFTKYSLRILEKVACSVVMNESVLLVGETGAGKTTSVQELANLMRKKLIVQNLSLSTDSSDLLGGFRPVTMRQLFLPTYELFVSLFEDTFSATQNSEFLEVVGKMFREQSWKKILKAFAKASDNAMKKLQAASVTSSSDKVAKWSSFKDRIARFEVNLPRIEFGFAFSFVEGLLVDAMRHGYWILLDEINLASPETLQGLTGILEGQSLCLTDRGDIEAVQRHPDFRLFAAMNPPTDIGKKELPISLRSRFTEIYTEELTDPQDLSRVVSRYLNEFNSAPIDDIVSVYLQSREAADSTLVDSAGQKPRYSLRSLTRSLRATKSFFHMGITPLNRALYEGFLLNFQTLLGENSKRDMRNFLKDKFNMHLNEKELSQPPSRPGGKKSNPRDWVVVKPFWLQAGPLDPIDWSQKDPSTGTVRFVITETVGSSIRDLSAAVSSGVAPILLQGPTSVGKTSMIEYLAARTGHKCVRINNHEHTDVQEYIGGYVTNLHGHLEFRDGLLVEALRNGHWIILDELNLAPSDVLEALNRLLDDNRELLIAETGEIVKPANGFVLFATQNPPGAYGGRKPLSRAFRNRFLELSVCDLPYNEIEEIISSSCGIAPKFSKMLVKTMQELQTRRQQSSIFQGKYSITTRDLIKWGKRKPQNAREVAEEGYMLLAERLRSPEEKKVIKDILLSICKVEICPSNLYDGDAQQDSSTVSQLSSVTGGDIGELNGVQSLLRDGSLVVEGVHGIAITQSMRRMWKLVGRCVEHSEPALLIGETGCGKTTICQLLAAQRGQKIRILNCHQSTETADIIGGLRPVRGRELLLETLIRQLRTVVKSAIEEGVDCSNSMEFQAVQDLISSFSNGDQKEISDASLKAVLDGLESLVVNNQSSTSHNEASDESSRNPSKKIKIDSLHRTRSLLEEGKNTWLRYKALFEWQDGPLLTAMKEGDFFLLDEINLADDAVIERLNSVLESGREITLVEKGGIASEKIVAHPNFRFLATMNPGGDFGKRELSPALRSRFTEIWVSNINDETDIVLIVSEMLRIDSDVCQVSSQNIARIMVSFMSWLNQQTAQMTLKGIQLTIREVLAWARFISQWGPTSQSGAFSALLHGAHMTVLDGLGIGMSMSREVIRELKHTCVMQLLSQCPETVRKEVERSISPPSSSSLGTFFQSEGKFSVGEFSIPLGASPRHSSSGYVLSATSIVSNLSRILRAMQLPRPILLEGPPGVGKSSLIANLAALTGHKLVRINLSEHSEISDLLGTDLPTSSDDTESASTDGGMPSPPKTESSTSNAPKFTWCDGVFLTALKNGDWVLLDELNLAPQSVLEGLNACFDHREEVFLPEIGKSFRCPPSFRVFCAQNPMVEGGGRKGLPQSFLTRFSRVFVEAMSEDDMRDISLQAFQCIPQEIEMVDVNKSVLEEESITKVNEKDLLQEMIPLIVQFVLRLQSDVVDKSLYGRIGSPWEFNLRDIFRWCELIKSLQAITLSLSNDKNLERYIISKATYTLFISRFRTRNDRALVCAAFEQVFGFPILIDSSSSISFQDSHLIIGSARVPFLCHPGGNCKDGDVPSFFSGNLSRVLEVLGHCVEQRWPVLLVGHSGSGKRRSIRHLASLTGHHVVQFSATPSTDSTELLGSFEQLNSYRHLFRGLEEMKKVAHLLCILTLTTHSHTELAKAASESLSLYSRSYSLALTVSDSNSLALDDGKRLFLMLQQLFDVISKAAGLDRYIHDQVFGHLSKARGCFDKCWKQSSQQEKSGFEWVDGVVVNAVEQGNWLIFENVNLCSASVLDRLNSLLEPNGSLLLTESGVGRTIRPHPNFRIFFTMDPSYGEISRAMRNRCLEISFLPESDADAALCQLLELGFGNDVAVLNSMMELYSTVLVPPLDSTAPLLPRMRLLKNIAGVFRLERANGKSRLNAWISSLSLLTLAVPTATSKSLQSLVHTSVLNFESEAVQDHSVFLDRLLAINPHLPRLVFSSLLLLWLVSTRRFISSRWFVIVSSCVELRGGEDDSIYKNTFQNIEKHLKAIEGDATDAAIEELVKDVYSLLLCASYVENNTVQNLVASLLLDLSSEFASAFSNNVVAVTTFNLATNYKIWIQSIISYPQIIRVLRNPQEPNTHYKKILLVSHQNYQKFVSAALLLGHDGSALSHFSDLSILKSWHELVDLTIFSRFSIIYLEAKHMGEVDRQSSFGSENSFSNLFSLAYALENGKHVADSRELQFLIAVFKMYKSIDVAVKKIIDKCLEFESSSESQFFSFVQFQELISFLFQILRARDILSYVLIETPISSSLQSLIPWEPIIVSTRWAKKCLKSFMNKISDDVDHSMASLIEILQAAQRESVNFEHVISEYWNRPLQNGKIRLWKQGGFNAVPTNGRDWDLLKNIRSSVGQIQTTLPSFVECVFGRMDIAGMSQSRQVPSLIREWLCLYSTFYWSRTSESIDPKASMELTTRSLASHQEVSMEPLLDIIRKKIDSHVADTLIPESSFLVDTSYATFDAGNGGETDAFFDESIRRRIERESTQACDLSLCIAMEPWILTTLQKISDVLGHILNSGEISLENIKFITTSCRDVICMALRYTLFSPANMRELQTLLWGAQAILDGDRGPIENHEGQKLILILARAILVALDNRLYSFTSRNISNLHVSAPFSYNSHTLNMLLESKKYADSQNSTISIQLPWNRAVFTGSIRLLQPNSLELSFRHVDVQLLLPYYKVASVLSFASNNVASISVSTSSLAKTKILQIFRALTGTSPASITKSFARMSLMARLALDVIISCSDFFDSMILASIMKLVEAFRNGESQGQYCYIFSQLDSMKLYDLVSNSFLSDIFNRCLQPVFMVLANQSIWSSPTDFVPEVGRAWALLGIIRALLIQPLMPVDPAAKALVKANLLQKQVFHEMRRLNANKLVSTLSDWVPVSPSMVKMDERIEESIVKVDKYKSKAIERPENSSPFHEIFYEIRASVDSLSDVNRLTSLIDRIFETFSDLQTNFSSPRKRKAAYDTLSSLMREEIMWQSSAQAFIERTQTNYPEFEDITSPVISALQNISTGLRLLAGWSFGQADDMMCSGSLSGSKLIEQGWKSIVNYPFSASVALESVGSVTAGSNVSVGNLLINSDHLICKAYTNLNDAHESQIVSDLPSSVVPILPKPIVVHAAAPHAILLLALAKIDYFVGGLTSSPIDMSRLFQRVLTRFVDTYLRSEEERRKREAAKASLFRNKTAEKSFEANDEKEENEALRHNFPDHLAEFKDIINGGDVNINEIVEDKGDENEDPNLSQTLDEHTAASLVSYHARMAFIYLPQQLMDIQNIWVRKQSSITSNGPSIQSTTSVIGKKKKNKRVKISSQKYSNTSSICTLSSLLERKDYLQWSLSKQCLLVGKILDWSLCNYVSPHLDDDLQGSSLMSLATMADMCSSNKHPSMASWLLQITGRPGIREEDLDRDLLFMLDCSAEGLWKPKNFHTDPNHEEVVKAATQLRNIFHKATELLIQFPGNEFLLQICKISGRISQFHSTTPLGKMLMSVEFLLRKAYEWEQYAAKHVSLHEEMAGISGLITQWRQLELKSWEELLRCKEVAYATTAMKYWFTLAHNLQNLPTYLSPSTTKYSKENLSKEIFAFLSQWPALFSSSPMWIWNNSSDAQDVMIDDPFLAVSSMVEGISLENLSGDPNDAADEMAQGDEERSHSPKKTMSEDAYVTKIFETLDAFMRGTVVGQFAPRLHLLRLFALQLSQEIKMEEQSATNPTSDLSLKMRIARLLVNLWKYYDQFLPVVRKFQDNLKGSIEQRLKEEVKIAKWDQLNAYALVESSEKVHRKLNKFIREYESDVLEYPVTALLRRDMIGDLATESGELQPTFEVPTLPAILPYLSHFGDELSIHTTVENIEGVEYTSVTTKKDDDSEQEPLDNNNAGQNDDDESPQKQAAATMEVVTVTCAGSCIRDNAAILIQTNPSASTLQTSAVISEAIKVAQRETWLQTFPKFVRLRALSEKADQYLKESLMANEVPISTENVAEDEHQKSKYIWAGQARYGLQCADIAEDMCDDIFHGIASLRGKDVTKPHKIRAVGDFLKALRSAGISHLRSNVPMEIRHSIHLMSLSSPMACEIASDLSWSSYKPRDLFEKAECYFTRNIAELHQLRAQSSAPMSKDVSHRDVQIMLGLSENLFCTTLRLRSTVDASFQDHRNLWREIRYISNIIEAQEDATLGDEKYPMTNDILNDMLQFCLRGGSAMLDNLVQLQSLLRGAAQAHNSSHIEDNHAIPIMATSKIFTIQTKLDKVISSIDAIVVKVSNGQVETDITGVEDSGPLLLDTYSILQRFSCSFSWVKTCTNVANTSAAAALTAFDEITSDLSTLVSESVVTNVRNRFAEFCDVLKKNATLLSVKEESDVIPDIESEAVQQGSSAADSIAADLASCIDSCLIALQKVRALSRTNDSSTSTTLNGDLNNGKSDTEANQDEDFICFQETVSLCMRSIACLQTHKITSTLTKVNGTLMSVPSTDRQILVRISSNVLILMRRVVTAHAILLEDLVQAYKSSSKLLYVSLRVFRTLLAKGICSAESKEEDGEGNGEGTGMTFTDDVDGTGMGEGAGKKDVSDQIDNEEQLLGLKDEMKNDSKEQKQEKKQLKEDEVDKGVEMTQDFDDEYFDLPEKKDGEEEEQDDDSNEEEELDREMGDADEDDIVDEKQWDSEEDGEGPEEEQKEKFEKDSKMDGEALEGEMTTKDENEEEAGKEPEKTEKEKKKSDKTGEDEDEGDNASEDDRVNEEEESEKPQGVSVRENDKDDSKGEEPEGQNPDDMNPEETADEEALPDDLQLDGMSDGGEDLGEDDDENKMNEDYDEKDQNENHEGEEDKMDDENEEDHSEGHDPDEDKMQMSGTGNVPDINEEQPPPDESKDEEKEDDDHAQNAMDERVSEERNKPPAYGVNSASASDSVLGTEEQIEDSNQDTKQLDTDGPSGKGSMSESKGQQGHSHEIGAESRSQDQQQQLQKQREPPNPFKQRGDVNEKWHRRLNLLENDDEAESNDGDNAAEPPDNGDGKGLYEHTKEDEKHPTEQVLSGTSEEDAVQLPDQDKNQAPEDNADNNDAPVPLEDSGDVEEKKDERKRERKEEKSNSRKKRREDDKNSLPDDVNPPPSDNNAIDEDIDADDSNGEDNDEDEDDEEGREETTEEKTTNDLDRGGFSHTNFDFRIEEDPTQMEVNSDEENETLEVCINSYYNDNNRDIAAARALWSQFRINTEGHSIKLCEQLRLILEPTLATRLKGDYRTGKRINMRRVIGYIASGFRKDKIWLRRTKPAKRDYQVMLMIDNSSSMGEAGPLALSAMTILSNALSRLEVGDLCVASFADEVRIIHPFGQPFNDEAGAQVLSHFDFTADRTLIGASLEAVSPVFASARSTSSSGSLGGSSVTLQLCFVISDARIDSDNRMRLDRIVRGLAEEHVLVVLIIIDKNDNPKDSIFNTKSVEFRGDKIITSSYLDNFPFPYYVAIQRLDSLPDILADSLKQWFEMVGSQLN